MTGGGLGGGRPGLSDLSWAAVARLADRGGQWPEGLPQCAALGDPLVAVPPSCDAVYRSGKRGLNTEAGPNRMRAAGPPLVTRGAAATPGRGAALWGRGSRAVGCARAAPEVAVGPRGWRWRR